MTQPTRILVIDDEAPIRNSLRANLEHSGYHVITADDESITVRHYLWEAALGLFQPGPEHAFARPRVADPATARG